MNSTNAPQKKGEHPSGTESTLYADYLVERDSWWKRLLDVQRPYRMHIRGLKLGSTLDIGCGVGRNLLHLGQSHEWRCVGIDHNERCVEIANRRGLEAYTIDQFLFRFQPARDQFDSLLLAHVLEHMSEDAGDDLIERFLPFLKQGGKIVVITPQERGFRSDATHVRWLDLVAARRSLESFGLDVLRQYSFPLPRNFGKYFAHNEFISVGRKPRDVRRAEADA